MKDGKNINNFEAIGREYNINIQQSKQKSLKPMSIKTNQ